MVYRVVQVEFLAPNRILLRQALTSDPKIVLDVVIVKEWRQDPHLVVAQRRRDDPRPRWQGRHEQRSAHTMGWALQRPMGSQSHIRELTSGRIMSNRPAPPAHRFCIGQPSR
jgi:hypothetical protein